MTPLTVQRTQALAVANQVRGKLAAFHRELAALDSPQGRALLAALIEECPDWIANAKVADVLRWPQRMGVSMAGRLLRVAGVSHIRCVGGLSARQRLELGRLLREG